MKFFCCILCTALLLQINSFSSAYNATIIIHNGKLMAEAGKDIIDNGVVVINDDIIIDVGDEALLSRYSAPIMIDADKNLVMPGLINAHTHVPMVAFRSLGEEGIYDRLFGYFFPLEKRFVNPAMVYKSTIHGCIEMVMGGVTTYCDMYYFMEQEAEAAKKIGIRCVLGETIIDTPSPDALDSDISINRTVKFIDKYKDDSLVIPAFAPHCPYTLKKKTLQKIAAVSEKMNARVIIHLSEISEKDNKHYDIDNASFLKKMGLLNDRLTVAHAIHLDKKQISLMKDAGVGVSYNPLANAKGATGIADAVEMLKQGIPVGLGTDGPMSSNQLSIIPVLSYAADMQRLKYMNRTLITPREVAYMATQGGANALHIGETTGSIEKTKKADIIIINTKSPNMFPAYDLYAALVFQANPEDVLTSIINGRLVMYNRALLTYSLDQDHKDMVELAKTVGKYGEELSKAIINKENNN